MCAVLVLAGTRGGDEPEAEALIGQTSKGQPLRLTFLDGELRSLETWASVRCPPAAPPVWRHIQWRPVAGAYGRFSQDGDRFHVRHRWQYRDGNGGLQEVSTLVMHGRLAEDGDSARGTVSARWEWRRRLVCRATVRFNAN